MNDITTSASPFGESAPRVLLVEDDLDIAQIVMAYLRDANYVVRHATAGDEAMRLFKLEPVQVVVLDLMLPGDMDGFAIAAQIRKSSNVPIMMLTARDAEEDKIKALSEVGVDDYMTKPLSPGEFLARVKALLRRSHAKKPGVKLQTAMDGRLVLDGVTRQVKLDDEKIGLAPKEFDLLWAIIEADGAVLEREELLENVWNYTYHGDTRTVDVHVRQLRRKIGDDAPIETVWGKGYRLSKSGDDQ